MAEIPRWKLFMNSADTLNLRHLRAFIAVADSGSVRHAAESLYRAQSAVSRSILELEASLGVDLFERKSSGMLLTAYGRTLLFRAQRAATEFSLAKNEMASSLRKAGGILNAPVFDMLFKIDRLQIFVAMAELHHMPTVAKQFGITQPGVSAAITQLEASLGVPLFTRTSKGIQLNELGEILLLRTKLALSELRHVAADMAALQGKTLGHVTVGAHPLSRTIILPSAIAEVLALYPNVRISTFEGSTEALSAGLRSGDLDFVLGTLRPDQNNADVVEQPLLNYKMSIFVRTGHPLTRQKKVTLEDLMQAGWILPTQRTPTRELFDLTFNAMSGIIPNSHVETSDISILRGLLVKTDLITAISAQQLDLELQMGVIQMLDFDFKKSASFIGLSRRAKSHPSPGAAALISAIERITDEMRAADEAGARSGNT